ncbi:3'(2'),5'-bisphosphate nucleotidase CysQ [Martelella endophytica]|uniref:3'(2'),5'-bisphosphate nucleotidase CysQ n=1 Tax=Martelella endophytica TaxID=1486262 RepID=A0A0D5LS03_MAREN|nr:3'(2'),5'-bisphosphate nucleotidase CysQ [Martelella endophytica]AJY46964.1 3'-5'-bisphosphate nucleotidase [Martelella endophytica]
MQDVFLEAALEAGAVIMDIFRTEFDVDYKDDKSPVTLADEKAEQVILKHLAEKFSSIPIVAEESVAAGCVPTVDGQPFFLVDPLDGTKEFVAKRVEFTVNIAFIEQGRPVEGIVFAPAKGVLYRTYENYAVKQTIQQGNLTTPLVIQCREMGEVITAVVSRSHSGPETEEYIRQNGVTDFASVGSSLKFCLIAEGLADVYPRFGRTMEWDTAAGDAILRKAGGLTNAVGARHGLLRYGKTHGEADGDFANPAFIGSTSGYERRSGKFLGRRWI